MARKLKLKRGLESNRKDITPDEGELIYTTDDRKVYVGDGVTPGGHLLATSFFSYEWNFISEAEKEVYSPTAEDEPLRDPLGGIYIVFYGATRLQKGDYSISVDDNTLTLLNIDSISDDILLTVYYVGI